MLAVVGPTAVGKSALALRLAPLADGEIVSADSRQVYRYMDIGTAKPSAGNRARVAHHMLDVVDPDDVELLQDMVLAAVNDGLRRAEETVSKEMASLTGGLKIPGLM